jgi:hypothetical protein
MILPVFWIICGIWFFKSAEKVSANPWAWVGIMMAASFVIYAALSFLFEAIENTVGVNTNDGIWPFALPALVGDIVLISVLRSYMMKRALFKQRAGTVG